MLYSPDEELNPEKWLLNITSRIMIGIIGETLATSPE